MGIEILIGKTLTAVDVNCASRRREGIGNGRRVDIVRLECSDGTAWQFTHGQECCEDVHLDDVVGDLQDIIGSPLLMAEEATRDGSDEADAWGSRTWTFYKFATARGYVTMTWRGESNGYYSERVDFEPAD